MRCNADRSKESNSWSDGWDTDGEHRKIWSTFGALRHDVNKISTSWELILRNLSPALSNSSHRSDQVLSRTGPGKIGAPTISTITIWLLNLLYFFLIYCVNFCMSTMWTQCTRCVIGWLIWRLRAVRLRSHRSAHTPTSELNLPKLNNFHDKIAQNQAPVWLSIVLNISCLYTCIFQLCNR